MTENVNNQNKGGMIVLLIFLLICSGLGIAAFVMSFTKKCGEGFSCDGEYMDNGCNCSSSSYCGSGNCKHIGELIDIPVEWSGNELWQKSGAGNTSICIPGGTGNLDKGEYCAENADCKSDLVCGPHIAGWGNGVKGMTTKCMVKESNAMGRQDFDMCLHGEDCGSGNCGTNGFCAPKKGLQKGQPCGHFDYKIADIQCNQDKTQWGQGCGWCNNVGDNFPIGQCVSAGTGDIPSGSECNTRNIRTAKCQCIKPAECSTNEGKCI